MTVPVASSMAPCRVALGAPSPNQRCMDASIWSSSPNLSLLGRDGCLAFSFLALCLLGDLIPADLSILYIAPYDIPIPSSSRSFSAKCLKLNPSYSPLYRETILPSVSGSVLSGLVRPEFPCLRHGGPSSA